MVGKRLVMADDDFDNITHYPDFFVDPANIETDARRLLGKLRPHWDLSSVNVKHFTDGITNRLVGCFPDSSSDSSTVPSNEDVVLIRVYGHKTELFIDRRKEIANMILMNRHGLSPPMYCSFSNGMAYGYSPGIVLDGDMVRDEFIYKLICQMMARMHSIALYRSNCSQDSEKKEACLFRLFRKYLTLLLDSVKDENIKQSWPSTECTLEQLAKEVDTLEEQLTSTGSPLVFCHNDLLLKNIIYDESKSCVTFIDFEYADINYQAFDIANHFNEFAGVDVYQPELYPSKQFQLAWLRCYLSNWDKLSTDKETSQHGKVISSQQRIKGDDLNNSDEEEFFEERVNHLYVQVSKFSLASNLVWGLWALLQSRHSSLDFDFFAYGMSRIAEYFNKKDAFLNLKSPLSSERSTPTSDS